MILTPKLICKSLLVVFLLYLTSCNKRIDIGEPTIDTCAGKHSLTANFSITEYYEAKEDVWHPFSTDTVANNVIKLSAYDSSASSYEWHIGAGVYYTQSIELEFPTNFLFNKTQIPITLTVKGSAQQQCFPGTDTILTQKRSVTFVHSSSATGRFQGHLKDRADKTFTINIDALKPCSDLPNGVITTENLFISNLMEGCETLIGTCAGGQSILGYKQIYFNSDNCQSMAGIISIGPNNNSITINYDVFENGYQSPVVQHTFIGKRVQ